MENDCKNLYVGNLDQKVTELLLRDIFQTIGPVLNAKIINDKNNELNYGFVEFYDHKTAEVALNSLDEREIFGSRIKVNWAFQGATGKKEEATHHIFVGDLSSDVNDQMLFKAFQPYGSLADARVMWDPHTGKSRGYGFVAFKDKTDAEKAINQMNGEFLGSRNIRCNWANQKSLDEKPSPMTGLSFEAVLSQTPNYNTTVYVGNVSAETTQAHLLPYFQQYGQIIETRMQTDKGYTFFKYDTHENAATAIFNMNGAIINGRQMKCSWGKEKPPASTTPQMPATNQYSHQMAQYNAQMSQMPPHMMQAQMQNNMGVANPNMYGYMYGYYMNQGANPNMQANNQEYYYQGGDPYGYYHQ